MVRTHLDYLIGRNVNRVRDGVSVRAFGFESELDDHQSEPERLESSRAQRAVLLVGHAGSSVTL
jgi:hypothetical protein